MPQPPRKRPNFQAKKTWKHSAPRPVGDGGGYSAPKRPAASRREGPEQGWDQVAGWYDKLVGDRGSDYHRNVILPTAMRLLAPAAGEKVLDLCCGQGVLIPLLLEAKVAAVTAVDASPRLIESAKRRFEGEKKVHLVVADACAPGPWADGSHDAAACIMAVHDVPDLPAMARQTAAALKPGGRFVAIFMHPCFRIPQQSHWGWDEGRKLQFRRVDRYGVPQEIPILTHPGQGGGDTTTFYHRPVGEVLTAFGQAGLAVTVCEELYSHRRSQPGPRAKGENRAVQEFPVFMAIRCEMR
ncbi:class I SAM-dependent methyltransferase [Luteolibacter sp. Populi]|uniref:class I SAM-dependent methyltransferase n=1 Tax=Luteolibacter sp. Populi TaxID=3230487 RepID=UPI003467A344